MHASGTAAAKAEAAASLQQRHKAQARRAAAAAEAADLSARTRTARRILAALRSGAGSLCVRTECPDTGPHEQQGLLDFVQSRVHQECPCC